MSSKCFWSQKISDFLFAQNIFGEVGKKPNTANKKIEADDHTEIEDKLNPFILIDKILIAIIAIAGLTWVINDPLSKIGEVNFLEFGGTDYSGHTILVTLILFVYLLGSRIIRYSALWSIK